MRNENDQQCSIDNVARYTRLGKATWTKKADVWECSWGYVLRKGRLFQIRKSGKIRRIYGDVSELIRIVENDLKWREPYE